MATYSPSLHSKRTCIYTLQGPIIVGASPLGLAVSACLTDKSVPFVILERSDCTASLWQNRTYDRLKHHLPKQNYQLPKHPFADDNTENITKNDYIEYLKSYVKKFEIKPCFNECVRHATYDVPSSMWHVFTVSTTGPNRVEKEYRSPMLVVATKGGTDQGVVRGLQDFSGEIVYAKHYTSGENYKNKNVIVVGCGTSGMDIALDLVKQHAKVLFVPSTVILKTTYNLSIKLLKWLPLLLLHLFVSIVMLFAFGRRIDPWLGPLQVMKRHRENPILDVAVLEKIRTDDLKVVYGLKKFHNSSVELKNGDILNLDSVILGAECFSSVPYWVQDQEFSNGWRDKRGLYSARLINGAKGDNSTFEDATKIAGAIGNVWMRKQSKEKQKRKKKMMC
ncbi:pyridine nucleotide-disulfide oxidoreductase, class-II [Artemisia annua]|uniref:indole-3-pyruvate monooxygenase n=1 Tax=Artemisia annua TaxID=35608 RepID=A0A2U1P8S4_ARTAN|nr:pyridine nucleotide-disulfide oxidoreductase, class-II [Artemisia annua]